MSERDFSHLIEIDESARMLRIHRIFPDGRRHLFTETPLPPRGTEATGSQHAEFARVLGENILLDSSAARGLSGFDLKCSISRALCDKRSSACRTLMSVVMAG